MIGYIIVIVLALVVIPTLFFLFRSGSRGRGSEVKQQTDRPAMVEEPMAEQGASVDDESSPSRPNRPPQS